MTKQKGFSLVEGLLIVLILSVVGFAGWFVWDRNENKTVPSDTNMASTQEDSSTVVNETENWLTYVSTDEQYSIKIPDGWRLVSFNGSGDPYALEASDIIYKSGTQATITNTDFTGDITEVAFAFGKDFSGSEPRGIRKSTFKTDKGLEVVRYDFAMESEPVDMDISAGTTRYDYRINDNGKTFQVVHDVKSGEAQQTTTIEKAIKTFAFN